MEVDLDSSIVSQIARRFILQNFRNVHALKTIEIVTALYGERWVYKVIGLATINLETVIPTIGSPVQVEVMIAQEGTVVAVQGQKWNAYQRACKKGLRRKR